MKKIILGVLLAGFVVSCKKVPQGGNLGRLKLEEGTERYSDDHPGSATHKEVGVHETEMKTDTLKAEMHNEVAKTADSAKSETSKH